MAPLHGLECSSCSRMQEEDGPNSQRCCFTASNIQTYWFSYGPYEAFKYTSYFTDVKIQSLWSVFTERYRRLGSVYFSETKVSKLVCFQDQIKTFYQGYIVNSKTKISIQYFCLWILWSVIYNKRHQGDVF